eukprot:CAMPEP_0174361226 /NCGR_PEP_ID=MMETSP0811_2-20130205/58209_1 /TAXON_ID=73025 ORGANISM="Eutreptiella gymnastica-like, Strain CCMP1594" /NCGR_SAMPLE_ID=MMETSP0811_2 /ASSEMBLY_ACC=CAM_ASM_000667 /LENGTH=142 /DNA_ID=CAMNT_0015497697 /DNA_START=147 /DNA_END=576 /DNA_ORIENTATION=+
MGGRRQADHNDTGQESAMASRPIREAGLSDRNLTWPSARAVLKGKKKQLATLWYAGASAERQPGSHCSRPPANQRRLAIHLPSVKGQPPSAECQQPSFSPILPPTTAGRPFVQDSAAEGSTRSDTLLWMAATLDDGLQQSFS